MTISATSFVSDLRKPSFNKVAMAPGFDYANRSAAKDTFQRTPRFGQNYTTDATTVNTIQQALRGGNATQWAPSYQASPQITQAVEALLSDKNAVTSEVAVQAMTEALALTRNTRALVQGKPVQPKSAFEAEARQFFQQVATEGAEVVNTLSSLQLPEESADLVKVWIAKTAPTLQLMGFSDAIPHAAQVSRLAAIRSAQRNESPVTTVASAIVGWIHDPKLPDVFENLATHPVVASSIVEKAFTEDQPLKTGLEKLLKVSGQTTGLTVDAVIRDMTDAAGINNDSAWVNQNVILNRMPQKGVPVEGLKETFWQRFQSLSTEQLPEALSGSQLADLSKAAFDTGIYALNKKALANELNALGQSEPLESLLVTETPKQDVLSGLSQALKAANAIESLQVPAVGLLNNSEALASPLAKSVGRNLAEADNSLLSPHKIVLTSRAGNVLARVASFVDSFQDNIAALPVSFRDRARQWQLDMTQGIIQAMESLTQRQLYKPEWDQSPEGEKLGQMNSVIKDAASWVKVGVPSVDYSQADDNSAPPSEVTAQRGQIQEVAKALQLAYNQKLITSPVMFQFKKP